MIVLEPSRWRFYEGDYSDYLQFVDNQEREVGEIESATSNDGVEKPTTGETSRVKKPRRKRKFPYRKVTELEADVAQKEELLEQLQAQLSDPEVHRDGQRAKETLAAFEETKGELETLYEHWEESLELN